MIKKPEVTELRYDSLTGAEKDRLQSALKRGATRREAMQMMVATGLSIAAAGSIVTAASDALAATPKKGGHLRQILRGGSTSDSLDPTGALDTHPQNTVRQLFNNLTEQTPSGSVTGELAESWEASPDAATWTFNLRKGVEFHNGKTLDADDVVESINLHRGEDSKSSAKGLITGVADVKAAGKNTVVFTLEAGDADLPFTLTDAHFPILPAGTSVADMEKGIGTGPFNLKRWEPGVVSASQRNPNYFKEGLPYFDSVETLHASDSVARESALVSGQVDVMDDPDLKTIDNMSKLGGVKVQETPGTKHYTFPMRMDVNPYDNNDVRTALKLSIDREQILRTILNGHGYIGNDHPISRSMRYFASELPQRTYDTDKAKFHLKKAGLTSLDITIHAGDIYPGGVDAAVLYKETAAKSGININIKHVPTDGYWSEVWNKVPFCVSTWSGRPTANSMFSLAFSNKSSWNETNWNNEAFEKLLVEARAELDDAKRGEMYAEMQRLVHSEGGLVAPAFGNFISVTSDQIWVPDQLASSWTLDGCKNTERWAFIA